jgi:putative ABC transport system ATP-binding protein
LGKSPIRYQKGHSITLLQAHNLTHSYESLLFEDIDIALNCGESVAVLGVSGSGKSTILHILATLLQPDQGSVIYKEKNIYAQTDDELLEIRRDEIGIIFQFHYLFKGFSAYENIEIATIMAEQPIDARYIEKFKIADILKQNIGELSGGQQQRVSIARVLSKKPSIIFADEPTGNLDSETANDVMDTIFTYIKEVNGALFLVTHDKNLASKCDHTYILQDQKLVTI